MSVDSQERRDGEDGGKRCYFLLFIHLFPVDVHGCNDRHPVHQSVHAPFTQSGAARDLHPVNVHG